MERNANKQDPYTKNHNLPKDVHNDNDEAAVEAVDENVYACFHARLLADDFSGVLLQKRNLKQALLLQAIIK